MKITLTNGTELSPYIVTGERRRVSGIGRDALNFVFPESTSLDEMDALFTAENCSRIIITDDENNEYIHDGYTVRAELARKPVVIQKATDTTEEVVEQRVMVAMAQKTYEETVLAETQAGLNALAGV